MKNTLSSLLALIVLSLPLVSSAQDFTPDLDEAAAGDPRAFSYDGCTLFPEGTEKDPKLWSDCCLEHDLYYWAGGLKTARKAADLRLRECVTEKGEPGIARLMYLGVKLGGYSPVKLSRQRWGNAWTDQPRYRQLTLQEALKISRQFLRVDAPAEVRERFILRLFAEVRQD
jgi:hypothetical protein